MHGQKDIKLFLSSFGKVVKYFQIRPWSLPVISLAIFID